MSGHLDPDRLKRLSRKAATATEKCFVRLDVEEEFPFLVTKMSPFYER